MLRRILNRPQAPSERLEIRSLMREVERISRVELHDPEARAALYDAIQAGAIIGLYTPVGYPTHTVELAHMPRDLDPRISLAQWVAWWRAGVEPVTASVTAQRARQANARQAAHAGGQD